MAEFPKGPQLPIKPADARVSKRVVMSLRVPESLKAEIADLALSRGLTLSDVCCTFLEHALKEWRAAQTAGDGEQKDSQGGDSHGTDSEEEKF